MKRRVWFLAIVIALAGAALAFGREPARPRRGEAVSRPAGFRETGRVAAELLAGLWTLQVDALAGRPAGRDWAAADRRAVWTRALLLAAVPARTATGVAPATATDAAFVAPQVRRPREPAQALGTADAAAEAEAGPAVFTPPEGGLSWPARGRLAAAFAPGARPPRQGVVVAAPVGSPVAAAADGRVAFVGALRGLGRMLIVSHGERRHTVYACLGQIDVAVDDVVARDAVLGRSGYCGSAKTAGVYFELRFGEKALNPAEWLAARQ